VLENSKKKLSGQTGRYCLDIVLFKDKIMGYYFLSQKQSQAHACNPSYLEG
jgi:hypothetical protein